MLLWAVKENMRPPPPLSPLASLSPHGSVLKHLSEQHLFNSLCAKMGDVIVKVHPLLHAVIDVQPVRTLTLSWLK